MIFIKILVMVAFIINTILIAQGELDTKNNKIDRVAACCMSIALAAITAFSLGLS